MKDKNINSYKDLIVWQKSIDLVVIIYKLTELYPKEEMFGLTSQMRRAAVSIASNIAEGSCRGTRNDYIQFLRFAYGSGAELETQIELSKRLFKIKIYSYQKTEDLLKEIMKMLNVLIHNLKI